jgi:uncharacterized protein
MKIPRQILLIVIIFLTISAYGQTKTEEQPYIEILGTAEKEVIPDEIYIKIIIQEKYVDKTKVTIEEQEGKLKQAITSIGVDLTNLVLSDVNSDYVTIYRRTKGMLTKKEFTLKVKDAAVLNMVFEELDKLDITDASISKVNHSKMDSLIKEIKIKALKAAKDKAEYLLTSAGKQLGEPLVIREIEIPGTNNYSGSYKGMRNDGTVYFVDGVRVRGEDNPQLQFQKIKIQTTIYAKFSIK